jgi:nicotinic acid mononucleotide adenylyltransferase
MNSILSLLFSVLALTSGPSLWAKELTAADLKIMKKIAVFPGTFDPPNAGHMDAIEGALAAGMDGVIVLPNSQIVHKTPLPYDIRTRLIEGAIGPNPKVLVPSGGFFRSLQMNRSYSSPEFLNHMLAINPELEIYILGGSDVLQKSVGRTVLEVAFRPTGWIYVTRKQFAAQIPQSIHNKPVIVVHGEDHSSSKVRRALKKNLEIYFAPPEQQRQWCEQELIPLTVCFEILQKGLYLGREENNLSGIKNTVKKYLRSFWSQALYKLGIYERFKEWYVALRNSPAPPPARKDLKILRELGRGMSSTGYLVEIEGARFVLKVPHSREAPRSSLKRAIETSVWLERKTDVQVPKLVEFDEHGYWALYEFVEGQSVAALISEKLNSGMSPFTPAQLTSMQKLFDQVITLREESGMFMDFAPDNIILRGDTAYLVDTGQTQYPIPLTTLAQAIEHWSQVYSPSDTLSRCQRLLLPVPQ